MLAEAASASWMSRSDTDGDRAAPGAGSGSPTPPFTPAPQLLVGSGALGGGDAQLTGGAAATASPACNPSDTEGELTKNHVHSPTRFIAPDV